MQYLHDQEISIIISGRPCRHLESGAGLRFYLCQHVLWRTLKYVFHLLTSPRASNTFEYQSFIRAAHPEELLGRMLLVLSDRVERPRARLVAPNATQRIVAGHQLHLKGIMSRCERQQYVRQTLYNGVQRVVAGHEQHLQGSTGTYGTTTEINTDARVARGE